MDDLIARHFQGRATEEEERRIRRWRRESPEHEAEYRALRKVWELTEDHDESLDTSLPPVSRVVALSEERRRGERRGRSWETGLPWAAAMAAALVAGFLVSRWLAVPDAPPHLAFEVVTGAGETTTTRLPDGSVIRLAPETRLTVAVGPQERAATLDGQAFFSVSRDDERPFRLTAAGGEARVLGTRFEALAREGDLRLVVVEGRVSLESAGGAVELGTRQVSHVREGGVPSVEEVEDVWGLIDWMGRFLAFESTPLWEVAEELERRFEIAVVLEDPELAEETVTVWFGDEPLDQVVSVLCRLVEAQCTVDGATVRMSAG